MLARCRSGVHVANCSCKLSQILDDPYCKPRMSTRRTRRVDAALRTLVNAPLGMAYADRPVGKDIGVVFAKLFKCRGTVGAQCDSIERGVISVGPHLANQARLEDGLLVRSEDAKFAAPALTAQVFSRISDSRCSQSALQSGAT